MAQCSGSSSSFTLPFGNPQELFAQYDWTKSTRFRSEVIRIAPYVGTDILYCLKSLMIVSNRGKCSLRNGMC